MKTCFGILGIIFSAVVVAARFQQAPVPTFHTTSELVVVDALVENKKTRLPVRTLQREDFEIYEDGVRQSISQFSLDTVPLSIVFLFDMTDSVRPVLSRLAEGAQAALDHLKAEDEVAVMLYAERVDLLQSFTSNRTPVTRAIQSAGAMHPGRCGRSPELCDQNAYFNEAIFQAAAMARKNGNPTNRQVIIWLTDNAPNIPNDKVHSEAEALGLLRETGIVVTALQEHSAQSLLAAVAYTKNPILALSRKKHPPGDVGKYTSETGGISVSAGRGDVSEKLSGLIDRIRSRYTIAYAPSTQKPAGVFCKIEVRVSTSAVRREGNVNIFARRGYQR